MRRAGAAALLAAAGLLAARPGGAAEVPSPAERQRAEAQADDFDQVTLYPHVSVGFGMLLLGGAAERPAGLHGYVLSRRADATRVVVDEATGAAFGYRLDVIPVDTASSTLFMVRVDIHALDSADEKGLKRIAVCPGCPPPRLVAAPVRFPPTQFVRDGDTIIVDMLVRPSTGEKIVDIVKFSSETVTREVMDEIRSRLHEALEHVRRGDEALSRGELADAAAEYTRSIDLQPDAAAHLRLARCLQRLGRHTPAQRQYERSLALKRDDAEAWHELAVLLHRGGASGQAASRYRNALKLRPDWALARRNLGTAHADRGELDDAFREYRQAHRSDATALESKDAACVTARDAAMQFYLFAKVYAAEGEMDAAVSWLKKAKDAGFTEFERLPREPEFKPLLQDPRLVAFLPRQSRS